VEQAAVQRRKLGRAESTGGGGQRQRAGAQIAPGEEVSGIERRAADQRVQPVHHHLRQARFLAGQRQRRGRYPEAARHHEQALAVFREAGEQARAVQSLNGLGEVHLATGRTREARSQYDAALTLATRSRDRYEQARAHSGLAAIHQATGQADQAIEHWREALDRFTRLGVPEADGARTSLAMLLPQQREEDVPVPS
jgi:tetratricopeptide (TPR) repeat protein